MTHKKYIFTCFIIGLLGLYGLFWAFKPVRTLPDHRPVVKAVRVSKQPMPIRLEAPGTVVVDRSVSLRPQVTGILQNIAFFEGQTLQAGQLLFEIDPKPFQETLHQAQATLNRDKTILDQNERDAKRLQSLVGSEYVSQQDVEQAETTLRAQADLVLSNYAAVRQAEIALAYTKIVAPIDGFSGQVMPQVGDLITTTDLNPLVTINQLDPLLIAFSISQNQLPAVLKAAQQGPLNVQLQVSDALSKPIEGNLVFIDNSVSTQTGTILLKARVANPDSHLWPGMMLQVTLILSVEPAAITIPASALQIDQQGHFVYCITQGNVSIRRVQLSRQIDNWAVIREGLEENEQVLLEVAPNLVEGTPVRIQTASESTA